MLAIEVTFLTGRYVATSFNDRRSAEWPPHPARLFSTLAATYFTSLELEDTERDVLEWLEALPAPGIAASEESRRDVVTVFVPVNDTYQVSEVDAEADAVEQAELVLSHTASSKEQLSAVKALDKARRKLEDKIVKVTAAPTKEPSIKQAGSALKVLPEYRVRQPRTFPSVTPEHPRVTFIWPEAAPSASQHAVLDHLLARVVRLGHSSSLVSARVVDAAPAPTWVPMPNGRLQLRVTRDGQLRDLQHAFERHKETEPRVIPARFEAYGQREDATTALAPASCFTGDWIVLRRVAGPRLPTQGAAGLARTVRRALLRFSDGKVSEAVSGHRADGSPSEQDHLALVPLPFVGSEHATGNILGIALVLPRDVRPEDRHALFTTIDAWERSCREPEDEDDSPLVPVHLGQLGDLLVRRLEDQASQATLQVATWCRPARVWATATPIALDRNPGDLGSRDSTRLAEAVGQATESVIRAVTRIGLPPPARVEILPAAPFAGAAKARLFRPFPDEPGKHPRVLTHALVQFSEPVRGPILLGAGRYLGLGLLRPFGEKGERQ